MVSWLLRFISAMKAATPYPAPMHAQSGHLPSLDGARAVSILLVLLAHYIDKHWFPGGLGVLIFFVISGFLITRLMIAERWEYGTFDASDFIFRRMFRLLPALLMFCAIVSIALLVFSPKLFDGRELTATIFYVENYFTTWRQVNGIPTTMPFTSFWSLSVEEQFYAGFALLAYFCATTPKRIFWLTSVATVVPLILRFAYAMLWPQLITPDSLYIYAHTETRIDFDRGGRNDRGYLRIRSGTARHPLAHQADSCGTRVFRRARLLFCGPQRILP